MTTTPAFSYRTAAESDFSADITRAPQRELRRPSKWGFPELFAVSQVAGPALLYLPGSQAFRVPLRIGVFAFSLLGLVWCLRVPCRTRNHPACPLLVIAGAYMALTIFHPETNTYKAGLAQVVMHFAIMAPLFWAPRYFRDNPDRLLRVLTILWVLNSASVIVGILQVRDPARWMPAEFTGVMKMYNNSIEMYTYRAADGSRAIRPCGLGDAPGAACGAGMFVGVVGLAFLGLSVSWFKKLIGGLMGISGALVIFLSHVRSSLVVLLGCAAVYSIFLTRQGRWRTVFSLGLLVIIAGIGSLTLAESLGGKSTLDRFATLLEDSPDKVYQKSARMDMVLGAFDTLLLEHPLGAGLGRWGMMRRYFGDENNVNSPEIWSEVQFASWVLDGGIVLLSLYLIALWIVMQRIASASFHHGSATIRQWAPVIIMLSAGPIAFLFSYTPFQGQMGVQFWFLIGAFEGVLQGEKAQSVPRWHRDDDPPTIDQLRLQRPNDF